MIDEASVALAYRLMDVDVAIIGAGMAGASIAAFLPSALKVAVLEAEDQSGYHSTGRSAAFYTETYGGPDVQPLTTASKPWYFSTKSPTTQALMVSRRGALHVAWDDDAKQIDPFAKALQALSPCVTTLTPREALHHCPVLRADGLAGGVWDPDCCDIDVAQVHSFFLRQSKQRGHHLLTSFEVLSASHKRGVWLIQARNGASMNAKMVVNAAGAWADHVARLFGAAPLGLTPMRRTIGVFEAATASVSPGLPLTLDLAERFYFKPQSGHVLVSPADETPTEACDVQPEEEDIAMAAHRVEQATTFKFKRIHSKWAGLRTFAPDRSPVYGYDDQCPNFFWCAGQGGFGIQTAPAAGELAATLLQQAPIPAQMLHLGITPQRYAPRRFSIAA